MTWIHGACECCDEDPPNSDITDIIVHSSNLIVSGDIGTPASAHIQQGKRAKSDGSSTWTNLSSPRALALTLGLSGDQYWCDRQIAGITRKVNSSGTSQWTYTASGFFPIRTALDGTQSPKVLVTVSTLHSFNTNTWVALNDATGAFLATGTRLQRCNDVQVDSTGWYFGGRDSGGGSFNISKAPLGANGPTGATTWIKTLGAANAPASIQRIVLGTSALYCFGTQQVVSTPGNVYLKLWAIDKSNGNVLATFIPHTTSGAGSEVIANSLDVSGDTVYIAGSTQPKRNPDIAPFEDLTCFWKLAYASSAFGTPSITMTIDQLYDGDWESDGQAREFRAIDCMAVDGTDLFFGMNGNNRSNGTIFIGPNLWSFDESTEALNWSLLA